MRKRVPLLAVLLLFGIWTFSQNQRKITGQVKDENGPVGFATITETSTSNSVTSDINGNFSITITGNQITITAVDHAAQTIAATGDVINITLARANAQLQEVVVTALGVRRSRNQVPYAAQQIQWR